MQVKPGNYVTPSGLEEEKIPYQEDDDLFSDNLHPQEDIDLEGDYQ